MDAGSSHRAEAERWLTAAEKLLATRDFHGTKSFAYRARECDPRLEATDRIIAVVDTLLAGERFINNQPDWYAILQLGHLTQGVDIIAEHYRRLAILLNPEYNRFAYADQAFRLVSEAWTVLSNPSKKAFYDNEIRMIQFGHVGFQPPKKTPQNREPSMIPVEEERPQLFENGGGSARQPQQQQPQPQPQAQQPTQARAAAPPAATAQQASDSQESPNFWTACPYCYVLYEYPRVYEDCALKCQVCERSFHAVSVPPPPVTEKDTYYNCWAYFPLAYSGDDTGPEGGCSWKPFSPMFQPVAQQVKKVAPKVKVTNTAPRVYYDDDDIYVEVSDSSDDSSDDSDDDDWDKSGPKKKKRRGRAAKDKSPSSKSTHTTMETPRDNRDAPVVSGGVNNSAMQGQERVEQSRKATGNAAVRKQGGRGAKALGKLDLNVEFNNEVEESSRAARAIRGHGRVPGVDDNIEGTGFFEGLDEFLNSLPILSAVGDEKVKAA